MTAVELIKAKEESASVLYHEFVLLSGKHTNSLICFFEGKDAPYYHLRLKTTYNGKYLFIKCGGKSQVLKVRRIIKAQKAYKHYKTAYFIDRDFDKSIKGRYADIYETPCYSIENLYSTSAVFSEVLQYQLGIQFESEEFNAAESLYDSHMQSFCSGTLLFNAWYSVIKEISKKEKKNIDVKLEQSFHSNFYTFDLNQVNFNYNITDIEKRYNIYEKINKRKLNNRIKKMTQTNLVYTLRGKFVFNFFIKMIDLIIKNSKKSSLPFGGPYKFNIDGKNALTLLSQYAETPDCLKDFISKYK